MSCGPCGNRRWVAVDPLTGDCLLPNGDGSCRRFVTRDGALTAARKAGHENPGVLRR